MKVNFYNVDKQYIEFLKDFEIQHRGFTCVPNIQYTNNDKFVYGTVLEIGNIKYYVPVSSKTKGKEDDILIKDKNNDVKGSLRFAFMIPIPNSCVSTLIIDDIKDENRKIRISKELAFCRRSKDKIEKQAEKTYHRIVDKVNDKLVHNSCDFKLLEQAYIKYCLDNGLELPKDLQKQEAVPLKEEVYEQISSSQFNDLANSGIHLRLRKYLMIVLSLYLRKNIMIKSIRYLAKPLVEI